MRRTALKAPPRRRGRAMSLLEVEDLRVTFPTEFGPVEAVRGVSFSLDRERLAIVGESGSGKTMTGRAILRLIPGADVSATASPSTASTCSRPAAARCAPSAAAASRW